jgi:coiled-coil domain-containing protein 115
MESEHVDKLLERYLGLLDEYTRLRESLSSLQSGMFQSLARANFSAERGIRYGQDYYDDRMQASRTVSIISSPDNGEGGTINFEVIPKNSDPEPVAASNERDEGEEQKAKEKTKNAAARSRDPLRWYGILAPIPLRQAQSQAVQVVESIVPRLVSVNTEMMEVEIEVRRARKKRAKAQLATENTKKISETIGTKDTEQVVQAATAAST